MVGRAQIVPLSADLEIRCELVTDPTWYGPAVDVRLFRRLPEGSGEMFSPTAAGFRLPPHLVEVLAYAMATAAEYRVVGPSRK